MCLESILRNFLLSSTYSKNQFLVNFEVKMWLNQFEIKMLFSKLDPRKTIWSVNKFNLLNSENKKLKTEIGTIIWA